MSEKINSANIIFCGQEVVILCDRKCHKAWGINSRPRIYFNLLDDDDFAFESDLELGIAPADPGVYEGGISKPLRVNEFPNKWCVRQCERSVWGADVTLGCWDERFYNQPWKHEKESHHG